MVLDMCISVFGAWVPNDDRFGNALSSGEWFLQIMLMVWTILREGGAVECLYVCIYYHRVVSSHLKLELTLCTIILTFLNRLMA